MSAKVGTFVVSTALSVGTDLVITGLGFRPDVLFFFHHSRETTGIVNSWGGSAFAWAHGTANLQMDSITHSLNDGIITTDHHAGTFTWSNPVVLLKTNASGGIIAGELDLLSIDADGFTLEVIDAFDRNLQVSFLAIRGVTNVKARLITQKQQSAGNQAYTGYGFKPDVVLFMSTGFADSGVTPGSSMVGMMDKDGNQGVVLQYQNNTTGIVDTARYCKTTECIATNEDSGGVKDISCRASFVSMDTDGFTLNFIEIAPGFPVPTFSTIGLKGGNLRVGNLLTTTGTGNFSKTGVPFKAEALLLLSHCTSESTADIYQDHKSLSYGAATSGTDRAVHAGTDEDNIAAGSAVENYIAHEINSVYRNVDLAGAYQGAADFVSFNADGFTLNMSDGDPVASLMIFLLFGEIVIRGRLVKYLYNTLMSRKAGRPLILDEFGREVSPEQVLVDQWIYADGPFFPGVSKPRSLIQDPRAFYIESLGVSGSGAGSRLNITTSREASLETLLRQLTKAG